MWLCSSCGFLLLDSADSSEAPDMRSDACDDERICNYGGLVMLLYSLLWVSSL